MAFTANPKRKQTGKTVTPVGINQYSAVDYSAPSSAPPAPVYGAPSTHDSAYDAANALAIKSLGDAQAYGAGAMQRLRQNYGYADDNFTLDLTNPFGQAQLLKKSFDQSKAGTQNSYAARGQQTSGAYNRMQGANLSDYQQRDDALQKSFINDKANLVYQATQAQNQYGVDVSNNEGSALDRAVANRSAYQVQQPANSGDKLLSSTKRKDGKTVNRYASGRVAVF